MDIQLLARIAELSVKALTVHVEVEGMKYANDERLQDNFSLAYPESAFEEKAVELRNIANDLHSIGY